MLRLFGAVVLIVLIVGPLLDRAGFLTDAGLFREFVDLEMRAINQFLDYVRSRIHAGA